MPASGSPSRTNVIEDRRPPAHPTGEDATPVPVYTPDRAAYAEAIEILLDLALRWPDKADGRAAAEVLLSAYNGYDFHLAPHEVRVFGEQRQRDAALTVIVQCAVFPKEPHQVVPDGERRFGALRKTFEDELHVRRRYTSCYQSQSA